MNDFPQRERIRLKNYDYSQNGYYFITICTYERQQLFEMSTVGNDLCVVPETAPQNRILQNWLLQMQKKFGVVIDKFVVMPDHIHLILIINSERHVGRSLPEMIRWFKTMTTNDFIKSVNAGLFRPFNKKIWQKSYYEHVIRNDNDYALTLEYICNNPLKLELIRGNAAVN